MNVRRIVPRLAAIGPQTGIYDKGERSHMTRRWLQTAVLAVLVAVAAATTASAAGAKHDGKDKDAHVQLLAINDFHGNLEPPAGSGGRITISPTASVNAGGAEYLATHIKALRAQNPDTFLVGAGD